MAPRLWLLVKWIDEQDVSSSYGVVSVNSVVSDVSELHPGRIMKIRAKSEIPKKAKILKISESKRYVQGRKEILEQRDRQVKSVVQMCLRNFKRSDKTESPQPSSGRSRSASPRSLRMVASSGSDGYSDFEEAEPVQTKRSKTRRRKRKSSPKKYIPQCEPQASTSKETRGLVHANTSRRQSIICGTPRPSTAEENITVFADKGTQTNEIFIPLTESRMAELEAGIRELYIQFQIRLSQEYNNNNVSNPMSQSEHNDEAPHVPVHNSDDASIETNHNEDGKEAGIDEKVGARVLEGKNDGEPVDGSNSKSEDKVTRTMRVRKVSAQTTNISENENHIDMVPIGSGKARVPARLLNDIDWNSHTYATRQLLQAVFPRSVLATHSLTGKQSPAFKDRPPKKILDPHLVDDIVQTVSTRCGVPKNLVRNSITIKCTDEAKLYRNRQQCKQARKPLQPNGENTASPTTASSDSPHAAV